MLTSRELLKSIIAKADVGNATVTLCSGEQTTISRMRFPGTVLQECATPDATSETLGVGPSTIEEWIITLSPESGRGRDFEEALVDCAKRVRWYAEREQEGTAFDKQLNIALNRAVEIALSPTHCRIAFKVGARRILDLPKPKPNLPAITGL